MTLSYALTPVLVVQSIPELPNEASPNCYQYPSVDMQFKERYSSHMKLRSFILAMAFVLAFGLAASDRATATYKSVGPEDFDKLRTQKNTIVLDVRTPKEYEGGHIPGAVNLDWNGRDFSERANQLAKGKTYLVYCASGNRSARAADKFAQLGFPKLYNLTGGIKAWNQVGKPIQ